MRILITTLGWNTVDRVNLLVDSIIPVCISISGRRVPEYLVRCRDGLSG